MAYDAIVLPTMIASPSDVIEERKFVRDTIHEWNDLNSSETGTVLLPVGWETHAAPDLSGRPQSLINERLLKHCDLLVGNFWTRLGSHTGVAESGTVEEIERHVGAGKTAMIYFSSRPVAPGSYESSQFEKVVEFKDWCKNRGIFKEFENIEDFRRAFPRDLVNILKQSDYLGSLVGVMPGDSSEVPEGMQKVTFSPEAIHLLEKAVDGDGQIIMVETLEGTIINAGGSGTIQHSGSARDQAVWKGAVDELDRYGLINDRGYKREVFEVTREGFEAIDRRRSGNH